MADDLSVPLWGPQLVGRNRTRFRLWAPACATLTLEIAGQPPAAMSRHDGGWFEAVAEAGPGAYYRFRLPDGTAIPDPASRAQAGDVHGWSQLIDPDSYHWRTADWRGRPWERVVLLERHAGLDGGFTGMAEKLPALAALGITAIEIMPVAAFPGTRNWGYDGVLPYAPAAAYGTPGELKSLIDRAHDLGLMIFLDVVYNHFGPDGNYLPSYAPDFFDRASPTPWGDAIDFGREEVARFFIDNALMWINEYRFDGLRFDAVHAIPDTDFLDRLAAAIRAHAGDRHIHLVLENEANDAPRLGDERYTAQWNDDFHNVLHAMLTGENQGYYQDFCEDQARKLARCLSEGFIYQGDPSPNQHGHRRGTPSAHLAPTRFVSFLQNHDQVGNRALGERLTKLTTPAKLKAATALLLLSPQIPLLFMGEEVGSETAFLFFTDFHDELADAVREGRRKEFAKFPAFADPATRAQIPDPNAPASFESSRPEPGSYGPAWLDFHRTLLTLRHQRIVPGLANARSEGAEVLGDKAVAARWSLGRSDLTIAINLGDDSVPYEAPSGTLLFVCGSFAMGHLSPDSFAAWLS